MSVQDGLDEMMGWMQGLEDSVREKGSVPLDSPALGSLLSKEAVRNPGYPGLKVFYLFFFAKGLKVMLKYIALSKMPF